MRGTRARAHRLDVTVGGHVSQQLVKAPGLLVDDARDQPRVALSLAEGSLREALVVLVIVLCAGQLVARALGRAEEGTSVRDA